MKKTIILILFIFTSILSFAPVNSQDSVSSDDYSKDYPVNYFRNPLNIPIQLAANFGELRSNHFHMGFDIRTNQRENLPVYAAAEGYISKVKIERFGFGRAIYINHPNGYTTLYAHLNDFYDSLNTYIKDKQYTDQQWEQEFELDPLQFPVKKGQFIAFSGNTGGSEGPHLHFEIRNTKTGNNFNPALFGLGLTDKVPPSIYKLYYFDRRYSTYQLGPTPISITGGNGKYQTAQKVVLLSSPVVSFGISAQDKVNISSYKYGIYEASLSVDEALALDFKLNDISYDDTRYVNACIDYKTRARGGPYIQHLSRLPGNYSTIFSSGKDGQITLADTLVHNAQITVKDAAGNSSVLRFLIKWVPSKRDIQVGDDNIQMFPEKVNKLKTDNIEADFSDKAFYDTVPFILRSEAAKDPKIVSFVHHLHNYTIPVHDSFTVRIKPIVELSNNNKDKVVMQLVSNQKVEAVKGKWTEEGWMEAKFRDLGIVQLLLDTIPARVALSGWANGGNVSNRKSISILVTDNAGEIESFKALMDGHWYMFSRKNDTFIHTFDERTTPGKHELLVTVQDAAGNITKKTYHFIR